MTFLNTTYRAYHSIAPRQIVAESRQRSWPRAYGLIFAITSSALAWGGVVKLASLLLGHA